MIVREDFSVRADEKARAERLLDAFAGLIGHAEKASEEIVAVVAEQLADVRRLDARLRGDGDDDRFSRFAIDRNKSVVTPSPRSAAAGAGDAAAFGSASGAGRRARQPERQVEGGSGR